MSADRNTENDKTAELLRKADSGVSISDAYNGLSQAEQRSIFAAMQRTASLNAMGVGDLQITGLDTDNDGKSDVLGDIYNTRTGRDLYNRPGESDNSKEAQATRQVDRLFKLMDKDKDGFASEDELRAQAANTQLPEADRALIRGLARHAGEIQGFVDDPGLDSKGISVADLNSPTGRKYMEWLNRPDVQKMESVFDQTMVNMVASGERLPGGGPIDRWLNNLKSKTTDPNVLQCYGQAERVLQNIDKAGLQGKWDLHMVGDLSVSGAMAMAVGGESPGHFRVELVPKNSGDPIVIMDPWKGTVELKDPATFSATRAFYPWTTANGDVGYGNAEERTMRQERARILQEWVTAGKPQGTFAGYIATLPEDMRRTIDTNNVGPRPSEYGFVDFLADKMR